MNESIHGETTASELQNRVTGLVEQQAAISEARAIAGSPHDLQPIFDAILDSATHLCRADLGSLKKAASVAWRCEGTPARVKLKIAWPAFARIRRGTRR
jgi:hypothetical protein